jgi:LacI family transcriptional regulator
MISSPGVDGVVLAVGADRHELARRFAAEGRAVVVIAQPSIEPVPGVGWVYLDLEAGARDTAEMLIDQGHRRIAFIGNYEEDFVRKGFTDELNRLGAPLQRELEVIAGKGREAGHEAMLKLLEVPERPTAVFARTDLLASGALQAARERRLQVPEDLSVVGHDDIPVAESLGLTTVRIDFMALGRAAARVLSGLMKDKSLPATIPSVRTHIVMRGTVSSPR